MISPTTSPTSTTIIWLCWADFLMSRSVGRPARLNGYRALCLTVTDSPEMSGVALCAAIDDEKSALPFSRAGRVQSVESRNPPKLHRTSQIPADRAGACCD